MAGDSPLALAWNRLTQASGAMEAGAAVQEYTDLFVGVGKSEVDLHASHWRLAGMGERSLVELRSDLARLGLSRRPEATMIEDHLSALCETMRILIAGAPGIPPREIATQRDFFTRYIASWVFDCCDAIRESTIANYYAQVAEWTHKYMAVERDALAMD